MTPSNDARSTRRRSGIAALAAAAVTALATAGPALAAAPSSHGKPATAATTTTHGNSGKPNPPKAGHPTTKTSGSAQAIVQSVGAGTVVLTELDGSTVSIAVTNGTRIFVNGEHASIDAVKPGFVVTASWVVGKAHVLQAFDLAPSGLAIAVVESVSTKAIVVKTSAGATAKIKIGPKTRLLLDGDKTTLRSVASGDTVVFTAASAHSGKPVALLRLLRPI